MQKQYDDNCETVLQLLWVVNITMCLSLLKQVMDFSITPHTVVIEMSSNLEVTHAHTTQLFIPLCITMEHRTSFGSSCMRTPQQALQPTPKTPGLLTMRYPEVKL